MTRAERKSRQKRAAEKTNDMVGVLRGDISVALKSARQASDNEAEALLLAADCVLAGIYCRPRAGRR